MLVKCICLSFSFFSLYAGRCLLSLLIRCSILKNSSSKGQSPWRVDELNRIIILYLLTELIERSVLSICDDSWVFCLLHLCIPVSLPPFHCARWSAFGLPLLPSFSHSTSLCLPYLSPFCPRHNSRRRSLFMRVPSHSDTQHLNRHMAWCGCHEILIQRCLTVLFLSNFPLYPIQLWFWWLSYSNRSFQLISIQLSGHHSDSARKHQSCNQNYHWFRLRIEGRLTSQKHISWCNSNKAPEFIASTVYRIPSLLRSKAVAVLER